MYSYCLSPITVSIRDIHTVLTVPLLKKMYF